MIITIIIIIAGVNDNTVIKFSSTHFKSVVDENFEGVENSWFGITDALIVKVHVDEN